MSHSDYFRKEFPTLDKLTYLNTAFASTIALPVYRGSQAYLEKRITVPDGMKSSMETIQETRSMVASLLGADTDEIALTNCAASGSNIAAQGLTIKAGENVIIDDLAYPNDSLLWNRRAEHIGFEVRKISNVEGHIPLSSIERVIDDRTKLVSVSHVSYLNGFRYDLKSLAELAHHHGAYLFSDSTQVLGAFSVNVKDDDVDLLTSGVSKWLLGLPGLAFFYIKRELHNQFPPANFGGMQIKNYFYSNDRTHAPDTVRSPLHTDARQYEFGSLNFQGVYALRAALEFIKNIGINWIEKRVQALSASVREQLKGHGFDLFTPHESKSGITTFFVEEEADLFEYLNTQKISITARKGSGQVRVSPHFYNTEEEIDRFIHYLVKWRESK